MSGTNDETLKAGAAEAARLVQEVQELGFQAARTVVERFCDLFTQFAAASGVAGTPLQGAAPSFGLRGSTPSMQAWQSDWQRAAASYMALMGQLNEAGLRFVQASQWSPPSDTDAGDLRLPDVAPGGRVSGKVWLHNTTASVEADLRPWCPGLANHGGAALAATTVSCAPERIDRLEPGSSRELLVTVAVGEDTVAGEYHGQLLVDGLADVVFPLRVRVLPATTHS
jgi:hypothetical protein